MKLSPGYKILFAAAIGLAFSAVAAHAQLLVNLNQQATFAPFTGGTNNSVTPNGTFNTTEVIHTGTPVATPFTITYNPLSGPSTVTLGTGTLDTSTFVFSSPITPLSYFTSLGAVINYDFDNNGAIDLTQNYTINLSPFTAPNGLTGVSYQIIPVQFFGGVTINGLNYSYASVVSNSVGTLFDGSSTTAAIQFQFLANTTPVPEPSTYALFGVMALSGIVWLRRRFSAGSGPAAMAA
jgi:hypothetical protein